MHRRRDQDFANQLLPAQDLGAVHHLLGFRPFAAGSAVKDGCHFVPTGIIDDQFEEEPIELGLRQWIGPFLFDRVLRGHDEEWLLEPMNRAAHRDAVLLHRFQKRRLRFRGGAIDFVGQDNLGE